MADLLSKNLHNHSSFIMLKYWKCYYEEVTCFKHVRKLLQNVVHAASREFLQGRFIHKSVKAGGGFQTNKRDRTLGRSSLTSTILIARNEKGRSHMSKLKADRVDE